MHEQMNSDTQQEYNSHCTHAVTGREGLRCIFHGWTGERGRLSIRRGAKPLKRSSTLVMNRASRRSRVG